MDLASKNDYQKAKTLIDRTELSMDVEFADFRLSKALIYYKVGLVEAASQELKRAVTLLQRTTRLTSDQKNYFLSYAIVLGKYLGIEQVPQVGAFNIENIPEHMKRDYPL